MQARGPHHTGGRIGVIAIIDFGDERDLMLIVGQGQATCRRRDITVA